MSWRGLVLGLPFIPAGTYAANFVSVSAGLPPSGAGFHCSTFNPGGWTGVAFADVDGDGDHDLAATGRLLRGAHIWLSDGGTSWIESSNGLDTSCHGRSDVDFADIDRDGDVDLAHVADINGPPAVDLGDGAGNWAPAPGSPASGNGEGITFGDFNGDGFADLATVGHFSGGVRAYIGDGAGTWSDLSSGLPTVSGGHRVTAADFDGDGRDELIDTLFELSGLPPPLVSGAHIWRLNLTALRWTLVDQMYFDQPYGVAAGDANNDGWTDLIVGSAQDEVGLPGGIHVFLNQAGVGFVASSAGLPRLSLFHGDVVADDFDGDGNLDIVAGDWSGGVRLYLGDGAGSWSLDATSGLPFTGDKIEGLAAGDIDGDCRLEVGIAAYEAGLLVYRDASPRLCAILPDAGPDETVCQGRLVRLDATGTRVCGCPAGDERFRWWAGPTLLRDWHSDPAWSDSPPATTVYRVDAACASDLGCFRSDARVTTVTADPPPAGLGNVLVMVADRPLALRFAWTDLPMPSGDYEIVFLPEALGAPTQAAFDGPSGAVAATAPPGSQVAVDADGLATSGLVFFRVRATSTCGGVRGPA